MRLGVPVFSYANFENFRETIARGDLYTGNLGDNMQSIAARRLLRAMAVPDVRIAPVDRDSLSDYAGEPVALIMNGVFKASCFPTPPTVTPVFMGFHAHGATIDQHAGYFARHAPIGCRDDATTKLFRDRGIEAFTTGCVTFTLAARASAPAHGRPCIVYGAGSGELPAGLLSAMPADVRDRAALVFQRIPLWTIPLGPDERMRVEQFAAQLLRTYCDEASLVITPLHHAAAPCMAMGIPVIVARAASNARFSFLESLVPVHTPETFDRINWTPALVDTKPVRIAFEDALRRMLAAKGIDL